MQKQTNHAAIYSFVTMVVSIILVLMVFNINIPTQEKVDYNKVNAVVITAMSGLNIPTVAEISSGIKIPNAQELDSSKVNDLWKVMFNDCYTDLESSAEEDVINEVQNKIVKLENYLEDNIVNFDELSSSIYKEDIDEDKTVVVITEIGYCVVEETDFGEVDEDKTVVVTLVYDFKYENTLDSTKHKESVTVTGTVVYEYDEDGNRDDTDVELVFNI